MIVISSEEKITSFMYLHGEAEKLAHNDLCAVIDNNNFLPIMTEEKIDNCTINFEGNNYEGKIYSWSFTSNYCHGLVCLANDEKANKEALEAYNCHRTFI